MYATGGRGGEVYIVRTLKATGPGSITEAVSRPNRFIVFAVSGVIDVAESRPGRSGSLRISQPNITIAGQTAPGEGITLINGAINVTAGNVIIRHLRVRRGFIRKGDMGDAIGIKGPFENVIVDHVSTSWATDENLTLTQANLVTAQYAIIAEALDYFNPPQTPPRHAFGSLFGSAFDGGRMTIHHSLYAHNRLRNARTTAGGRVPPVLDFRNNVIYDCKEATSHTGSEPVHANWIANYVKDGPSTGIEDYPDEVRGRVFAFHSGGDHKIYLDGNYLFGNPERTADNWLAVSFGRRGRTLVRKEDVRALQPFDTPSVTTQTASEAYETVLEEAGAILPSRDIVDWRVVRDVRDGTGAVINTERDIPEAGRALLRRSLPPLPDTDGDGVPDYWEVQFGLDPKNPSDAMADLDGDGYANIEEYVNNTDPRGGKAPLVYVSASCPRAWAGDGRPGAFRFWRSGGTDGDLAVSFSVSGAARPNHEYKGLGGRVVIPAGKRYLDVPVEPLKPAAAGSEWDVIAAIQASPGYKTGCPPRAVVVVTRGSSPPPVRLSDIAPDGGATEADLKRAAEVKKEHKVKRDAKLKARAERQSK